MTIENVHLISLIWGGFKEYMRGKIGETPARVQSGLKSIAL